MKHIASTLAFICLMVTLFAHPAINEKEERGLLGNVKTLSESSDYSTETLYEFDQDGLLIQSTVMYDQPAIFTYHYLRDKLGRINTVNQTNADGDTIATETFSYDSKGMLGSSHFRNAYIGVNYVHYWNKDARRTKVEYLYDDGTLNQYTTYEYDKQGFLIKTITYDEEGLKTDFQEFTNDQYGNAIQMNSYNADGILYDTSQISYEYDAQGNYIKMTSVSGTEDKISYISKRSIVYY